jgi:hypothetical protein
MPLSAGGVNDPAPSPLLGDAIRFIPGVAVLVPFVSCSKVSPIWRRSSAPAFIDGFQPCITCVAPALTFRKKAGFQVIFLPSLGGKYAKRIPAYLWEITH